MFKNYPFIRHEKMSDIPQIFVQKNHHLYKQKIVAIEPDKYSVDKKSESREDEQEQEFKEEGQINVKPFLDPSDGGTLGQEKPNEMLLLLFILVSILVISVIANSFLAVFRQLPDQENAPKASEDEHSQDSQPSDPQEFMTVSSPLAADSDNDSYPDNQEYKETSENLQDSLPNQVKTENSKIQDIFDDNTIKPKINDL